MAVMSALFRPISRPWPRCVKNIPLPGRAESGNGGHLID
jgi:hypothetical protein